MGSKLPLDVCNELGDLRSELDLIRFVANEIYDISSPIVENEKEAMVRFWLERKRLYNLSRILTDYVHNQIIALDEILKDE